MTLKTKKLKLSNSKQRKNLETKATAHWTSRTRMTANLPLAKQRAKRKIKKFKRKY